MTVWLVRAGKSGEYEARFLEDQKIYLSWDQFRRDVGHMADREQLTTALQEIYPTDKAKAITNWNSQIWSFAHRMQPGDLVVTPSKKQPSIYVGEIAGDYQFDQHGSNPLYHSRQVKWRPEPIPRTHFSQDLLYSFGAFLTICRITRNNAEQRLRAMQASGWTPETLATVTAPTLSDEAVDQDQIATDLATLAQDQITKLVAARFKGHELTRLVTAILRAQGYTTYQSPEGPDGGIDILAGTGALGFGEPRLCVQVKSQDSPVEMKAVNELKGAMHGVAANQGLFVAWGGFKSSVTKQLANNFFNIRLWTSAELLQAVFDNYDRLDEDVRAELPLKRIWTVADPGDGE